MDQSFPKSRRMQLFSGIVGARLILLYILEKCRTVESYESLMSLNPVCVPLDEGNRLLTQIKEHDGTTTTCMLSLPSHFHHQRINWRQATSLYFFAVKNQNELCLWFKWLQAYSLIAPSAVIFNNNADNCNIQFAIKIHKFRQTLRKPGWSLIHSTSTPFTLFLLKVCGISSQRTHSSTVCIIM